ncbi:MAG TPA: hypothetical protein ENJ19_11200 [Gammaproteobacteria bacterium]|nr:hypothetical protein [Gammaproteobacteria bacterium]
MNSEIDLPVPPLCAVRPETVITKDERVVLELSDGRKLIGALQSFDADEGQIEVSGKTQDSTKTLGMHEIRLMHAPEPRLWLPDEDSLLSPSKGVKVTTEPLEFEIEFNDHSTIDGSTFGFRNGRHGIHLFPVLEGKRYTHLFVPNGAIARHRIGKQLGQQLVKDRILSERDVAMVLLEQQEKRSESLGDVLTRNAIISPAALERAVKRQERMPHMQLGEILVEERMIERAELDNALAQQKQQRRKPLGELLVARGLVTAEDIQKSLASKYGVPYVNLREFPVDYVAAKSIGSSYARCHTVLPVHRFGSKLVVAMDDPTKGEVIDALHKQTGQIIEPVMAGREDILWAIDQYNRDHLEPKQKAQAARQTRAPGPKLRSKTRAPEIMDFISRAAGEGASYIHFECQGHNRGINVSFRIAERLEHRGNITASQQTAFLAQLKTQSRFPQALAHVPQRGELTLDLGGQTRTLPLHYLPCVDGREDYVLHCLPDASQDGFEHLDLSDEHLQRLIKLSDNRSGLILVTGPRGQGKSTTLRALFEHINGDTRKAWMVGEHPFAPPPNTRQLRADAHAFNATTQLKQLASADADAAFLPTVTDAATTQAMMEFVLGGRLALASTLSPRAADALTTLLHLGAPAYALAEGLRGVLGQRLARRLCTHCKERYHPAKDELIALAAEYHAESAPRDGAHNPTVHESIVAHWTEHYADMNGAFTLYRRRACPRCHHSGYSGRLPLHELLEMTAPLRQALLDGATNQALITLARQGGMKTLKQDGIEKLLQGQTDLAQVRAACTD